MSKRYVLRQILPVCIVLAVLVGYDAYRNSQQTVQHSQAATDVSTR